jgi:UDP-N-acetyl-2-amino-2-deoxyglucuronate dehydrogenase
MKKLGIIGGGNISETHARAAKEIEGLEIAAIYGKNKQKTERLAQTFGGTPYEDLPSFLKHERLDLVMIGSPSGMHAEHGIASARSGLHVLVEKPIDITTERADQLIDECQHAGVKLGVCFQDRVSPDICRLKQMVDEGRLGKPILVSGRVKWYRPPEYYSGPRWRGTWALDGGGALMNQGVHTLDLLLWLMGDVASVSAKAVTALHTIEVEDTLVATLEFANGAVGTLEAATSVYPGYQRRVEVSGTEGTIILEHDRIVAVDLRNPPADAVSAPPVNTNASANSPIVSDVRGHQKLLENFLLAIANDSQPVCNGLEGRRSVALVQAIYESSRTGQKVLL